MHSHLGAELDSQSKSSANGVAEGKAMGLEGKGPDAAQLKAFTEIANNSSQTTQLKSYLDMASGDSPAEAVQLMKEEEKPLQKKSVTQLMKEEEKPLQKKSVAQLMKEEEKPAQKKGVNSGVAQLMKDEEPVQRVENKTGMSDNLKSGIENLSGISMDDVRVHTNSSKPAQLQAHAYTQGTDIHVASGQEKHVPHEAWHVVQQKQGRVEPTTQMKGVNINDDAGLETEADVMGAKAAKG